MEDISHFVNPQLAYFISLAMVKNCDLLYVDGVSIKLYYNIVIFNVFKVTSITDVIINCINCNAGGNFNHLQDHAYLTNKIKIATWRSRSSQIAGSSRQHNSCCYATMQHLMTSFCNIWWHHLYDLHILDFEDTKLKI